MCNESSIDRAIFSFVYSAAMVDATRRTSCASNISRYLGDEDNVKNAKNTVQRYCEMIINGKEVSVCELATEVEKSLSGFTFGNAQKLINMTMKYLFISCYDNPEKRIGIANCDAPMDSAMRDFVYRSYRLFMGEKPGFYISKPWSNLDGVKGQREYLAYQAAIEEIILFKGLHIRRIEFDYLFWDEAKRLIDQKSERQNQITMEIWEHHVA